MLLLQEVLYLETIKLTNTLTIHPSHGMGDFGVYILGYNSLGWWGGVVKKSVQLSKYSCERVSYIGDKTFKGKVKRLIEQKS